MFTTEYSSLHMPITEDINNGPLQCLTVRRMRLDDNKSEIGVFADGVDDFTVEDKDESQDTESWTPFA
jgi:hypothetical protein